MIPKILFIGWGYTMLRMKPIQNANRACLYYEKSDAGYYQGTDGLHCEWGGKGADRLALFGDPDYEHFKTMIRQKAKSWRDSGVRVRPTMPLASSSNGPCA